MKIPRDVSGEDLARRLRNYGYVLDRQTGSHMRLTSTLKGSAHHITIPAHRQLRIGTLAEILGVVSEYLKITREKLVAQLFR